METNNKMRSIREQLLPPTERGTQHRQEALMERLDQLDRKIEESKHHILDRIDGLEDRMHIRMNTVEHRIWEHENNASGYNAQSNLLLWELLRQDGETYSATKQRFYLEMPKAEGSLRLLQLANAHLLKDFKEFCEENNLEFFLLFGTLLGAIRHKGTIPWDDDLDIGMVRENINALMDAVEKDPRYTITTVYDQHVYCKQIRFCYANEAIPCFVDIFYYDYAPTLSTEQLHEYERIREDLKQKIREVEESYLSDPQIEIGADELKYVPASSPLANGFEECFLDAQRMLKEAGIVCDKEHATQLLWSTENMDGSLNEILHMPLKDLYPFSTVTFEEMDYPAPRDADRILKNWYKDWMELPKDMASHYTHTILDNWDLSEVSNLLEK